MGRSAGLARFTLRALGLYERGRRNALDLTVNCVELLVHGLPGPFEGFRILHLSDLHFRAGGSPLEQKLLKVLSTLEADAAVITGDVVSHAWRHDASTIAAVRGVVAALGQCGKLYAVPGNHDSHEMMRALSSWGVRVLEDRRVRIERGGEAMALAGIRSLRHADRLERRRSLAGVPSGGFTALLAHEPDWADRAARRGVRLYLCGHTHGGQVNLPLIGAPALWKPGWRGRGAGAWRVGRMAGYTSRGLGTSYMAVRFGCPPEVALITLRPASTAAGAGSRSR